AGFLTPFYRSTAYRRAPFSDDEMRRRLFHWFLCSFFLSGFGRLRVRCLPVLFTTQAENRRRAKPESPWNYSCHHHAAQHVIAKRASKVPARRAPYCL